MLFSKSIRYYNSIMKKEIKITFGYVGVVFFLEYGCIER